MEEGTTEIRTLTEHEISECLAKGIRMPVERKTSTQKTGTYASFVTVPLLNDRDRAEFPIIGSGLTKGMGRPFRRM